MNEIQLQVTPRMNPTIKEDTKESVYTGQFHLYRV